MTINDARKIVYPLESIDEEEPAVCSQCGAPADEDCYVCRQPLCYGCYDNTDFHPEWRCHDNLRWTGRRYQPSNPWKDI